MIRWDEMIGEPADGEHILDDDGHPCLREVTDYADSGTGKSGEPAYCTRRIIGVQPLVSPTHLTLILKRDTYLFSNWLL